MPKETRAKFGDKITVRIKRGKKAAAAKKPKDDRRYGPPPIGDDLPREPPPPIITVHDMAQIFNQRSYGESLAAIPLTGAAYETQMQSSPGDFFYWGEMFYEPSDHGAAIGFLDDEIDSPNLISQALLRGPSDTGFPPFPTPPDYEITAPVRIFDEPDVWRLDETNTRVNYRKNDNCWPLPKEAEALGVTLSLGVNTVELGGSKWALKPQKAENKAAELAPLTAPIPQGTNAWARGCRDFYSKPGCFRPRAQGSLPVKVDTAGHFYESFNTADTTNFKVTAEPLYSAPEVSGRFTVLSAKPLKVFLAPQLWKSTYSAHGYAIYDFARTLPVQKWYRYRAFSYLAFLGDLADSDWTMDRHAELVFGSVDPNAPNGMHLYQESLDYFTLPITEVNYPRLSPGQSQIAWLAYNQVGIGMFKAWIAQGLDINDQPRYYTGDMLTQNTQTPAERLVGAIQVSEEKKYYVWRKTSTARDIVNLYSGKTSPVYIIARDTVGPTVFDEATVPDLEEHFYRIETDLTP